MAPNQPKLVSRKVVAGRRARVIAIAEALPETSCQPAGESHHDAQVRGKRFAYLLDNHHGNARVALNCKAGPGVNTLLAAQHPDRYHIPAYVGKQGWLGLWLDLPEIDWDEVRDVLVNGWRLAAPKKLVAAFERAN